MDDSRRKMLDQALGALGTGRGAQDNTLKERDARVRQSIADLYLALSEVKNPDMAINMLAEHVAIMVDMINEFKTLKR